MPVKRRTAKRRFSTEELFFTWGQVLETGTDYFSELPALGFKSDRYGKPDRDEAREMWRMFGSRIMAEPRDPALKPVWGFREFGDPMGGDHAG